MTCFKWLGKNCTIKLQHNSNLYIIFISQVEKLCDKWSYWFKVFFGGTNCEVKHLGLIVRVPGQKNTHRELKVDTMKCNSGAIQPNPPQRIHKSAQSCGHPPSSVNHLKHLAAAVGTPASSPDLSCTHPLPALTGLLKARLQVPPHLNSSGLSLSTHRGCHCQHQQAQTAGLSSWAPPCNSKSSSDKCGQLYAPSARDSNNLCSLKN